MLIQNDWDTLAHSISSSLMKNADLKSNTEQLALALYYFYDDKPKEFNEALDKFTQANKDIRQTRLSAIKEELTKAREDHKKYQLIIALIQILKTLNSQSSAPLNTNSKVNFRFGKPLKPKPALRLRLTR